MVFCKSLQDNNENLMKSLTREIPQRQSPSESKVMEAHKSWNFSFNFSNGHSSKTFNMVLYKFERLCRVSLTVITQVFTNKKQMCSMHSCYHQYSMCIYSQDYLQLTSCLTSWGIGFKKEKQPKYLQDANATFSMDF